MRNENILSVKTFILEFIIYSICIATYFYLNYYVSDEWFREFYRQGQRLAVFEFIQQIDGQITLVLGLLILAVVLFALESISVDIITF